MAGNFGGAQGQAGRAGPFRLPPPEKCGERLFVAGPDPLPLCAQARGMGYDASCRAATQKGEPGLLPLSGLAGGEFALAVSADFLFLLDDLFDYDFHRRAVFELLRICSKETRVFPLESRRGGRSPFVRRIVREAFDAGFGVSIEALPEGGQLRLFKGPA